MNNLKSHLDIDDIYGPKSHSDAKPLAALQCNQSGKKTWNNGDFVLVNFMPKNTEYRCIEYRCAQESKDDDGDQTVTNCTGLKTSARCAKDEQWHKVNDRPGGNRFVIDNNKSVKVVCKQVPYM